MSDTVTEVGPKIPVIEIFGPTIQGEGMVCGVQTHFIRFGGCDYKCTMCDSMHAVDKRSIQENATYMTVEEITDKLLNEVLAPHHKMLTLSGGNPALWELGDLVKAVREAGHIVAIETQGTYYKDWIATCDVITISPKGPGMGEDFLPHEFDRYMQHVGAHPGLNIKVVAFGMADLEFALSILERTPNGVPFYISVGNSSLPGSGIDLSDHRSRLLNEYAQLAEEMLGDPRFSEMILLPQMHVLAWGNKPGV